MTTFNISQDSSERAESEDSGASTQPKYLSYERGAILTFKAHELGDRVLSARIVRVYRPFSYSCVMSVEILSGLAAADQRAQRAVLKLYDRRCAAKLRTEHRTDAWNSDLEDNFTDFVNSGAATRFMNTFQQPDHPEEAGSSWSAVETETWLQRVCTDMYDRELEAYQHLRALQGQCIPTLFSTVSILTRTRISNVISALNSAPPLLQVRGFLMEHVAVGYQLGQMRDVIPRRHWQSTVDEALRVTRVISEHGVINATTKARNLVASPVNDHYRVVMVGFAHSIIRHPDQSDGDWETLKENQDEEGLLVDHMAEVLNGAGFRLQYLP